MIYKKKKKGKKPDYLIDEKKTDYPFFDGYYLRENDVAIIDEDYSFFDDNDYEDVMNTLGELSAKELKDLTEFIIEQLKVFPDDWWYLTAKKALCYLSESDVEDCWSMQILILNICCQHQIIFSRLLEKFNNQFDAKHQLELPLFS